MAAESGYYYMWASESLLEFNKLIDIKDWGWKATVLDIVKSYNERMDGSFIVNKDSCIRWFYRDVDTDFGVKASNELVAHLHAILKHLPLDIIHGKSYIEVKPKGLGKGTFAKQLLNHVWQKKGAIDFILCVGDSDTDEEMYAKIKDFPKSCSLEVKLGM